MCATSVSIDLHQWLVKFDTSSRIEYIPHNSRNATAVVFRAKLAHMEIQIIGHSLEIVRQFLVVPTICSRQLYITSFRLLIFYVKIKTHLYNIEACNKATNSSLERRKRICTVF